MNINSITAAQYRAAWRPAQKAGPSLSVSQPAAVTEKPSGASGETEDLSPYIERIQLPNGMWCDALNLTKWGQGRAIPTGFAVYGDQADAIRAASEMPTAEEAQAAAGQRMPDGSLFLCASPSAILRAAYEERSAGREPLTLPEDRNTLASFLRERYTGPMDKYERMEVFSALRKEGVISDDQYDKAMGFPGYGVIDLKTGKTTYTQEQPTSWCDGWERIHRRSVFARCSDVDDIISWLSKEKAI